MQTIRGAVRRAALLTFLSFSIAAAVHAAATPRFDRRAATEHVRHLSVTIGVRRGGTAQERAAAAYIVDRMQAWGYKVVRQAVPLPNGLTSENLIFEKPGKTDWHLVVGGHIDSKPPAPGANDNGSGVATILELAHALAGVELTPTIRFVFFGTEEIQNGNHDWHHFGSRQYVAAMSADDRARCGGMICIDSVAGGPHFVIGSMHGNSPLEKDLRTLAQRRGIKVLGQRDPGWSDHQSFEEEGFAVAYVRWRVDPTLHSPGDDFKHIQPWKMAVAGDLVLDYLLRQQTRYPAR